LIERIAELVEQLEAGTDPASKALSKELLQGVMELHAAGLGRLLDLTRASGAPGEALVERFARDPTVRTLLLLHDLHPWDAATRVREALRTHEGKVEILRVDDSSAHVRVDGPTSLARTIEDALREAAPDVDSIVVERQEPLVMLERRR
jgi:Fe-S cluster biogenesis protein NfuA